MFFELPTRLIDVGDKDDPKLRLIETPLRNDLRYLVLSCKWGPFSHFNTTSKNVASHNYRIEFEELPKTFQDAVVISRELGVQYLWIDSVCIIVDVVKDLVQEMQRMEDTFSNAYCVLAASSTEGQSSGFLGPRKREACVKLAGSLGSAVWVTPFIDDFDKYVLSSPLCQRAWALQERALARRTIYFTSEQTFWECGRGVRCETMTNMNK